MCNPHSWTVMLAIVALISPVLPSSADAQWTLSAEVGADRYWGGSKATVPGEGSVRPFRPTSFGLGFHRRSGALGFGIRLNYSGAALAFDGEDAIGVIKGVFDILSASPEIVYQVASVGSDNELLLRAGPTVEAWLIEEDETRVRVGGRSALSLRIPFGGRLAGLFLAEVGLTASPFKEDELSPDLEPSPMWRRRAAAALEYRL